MEKEKKKISCSYAVLVIILFATVCFLTDYIVIERKLNKCNCPKCEAITKNGEKEDVFNYSYQNIAGMYEYDDPTGESYIKLYLYTDGSYYYQKTVKFAMGEGGYYTINGDMINLNFVFTHGSDIGRTVIFKESKLQISEDGIVVDKNLEFLNDFSGFENIENISLNKKQSYDNSQNNDSEFKKVFSFGIFDVAKAEN